MPKQAVEGHTHPEINESIRQIELMVLDIRNAVQGSSLTGGKGSIDKRLEGVESSAAQATEKINKIFTDENVRVWEKVKLYVTRIEVTVWILAILGVTNTVDLALKIGPALQGIKSFIKTVVAGSN